MKFSSKIILLATLIMVGVVNLPCAAQSRLSQIDRTMLKFQKLNPTSRSAVTSGAKTFFVEVTSPAVFANLEQQGVKILYQNGKIATAQASADMIARIASLPGIKSIKLSRRLTAHNDHSKRDCHAFEAQQGIGLPEGFTGKGALVGIVDIGIDPAHINFRDSLGNSRVQKLWQFRELPDADLLPDSVPHTELLVFPDDYPMTDYQAPLDNSHGTHTLGTIAGSFIEDNPEARDLRGVAYGADIIACESTLDDAEVISCIGMMADYALEQNRPIVINVSLGSYEGPHDATEVTARMIDEIAVNPLVTVMIAAGNEATFKHSLIKQLTAEDSNVNIALQPIRLDNEGMFRMFDAMTVWSDDDTPFKASFQLYDVKGYTPYEPLMSFDIDTALLSLSNHPEMLAQGSVNDPNLNVLYQEYAIEATSYLNPDNNRYCTELIIYINTPLEYGVAYRFIPAIQIQGQAGHKVYAYGERQGWPMEFTTLDSDYFDAPTVDGSVSSMACGNHTICVGASDHTLETPARGWFSGYGLLNDGRSLPYFIAPGNKVLSSMSTPFATAPDYDPDDYVKDYTVTDEAGNEYYYTTMSGTSMATPFATGAAALWLSANPDLTTQDILNIATSTATDLHDPMAGAGIINVYDGLKMALSMRKSGIENVTDRDMSAWIHPLTGKQFDLFNQSGLPAEILVHNIAGELIHRASFTGTQYQLDLSNCPSGIYLITLNASGKTITKKFGL